MTQGVFIQQFPLLFVHHTSTVGSMITRTCPHLARHGRRLSIILRFAAIPVYLVNHSILTSNAADPRVVCPRTCRWLDLFFPRGCTSESRQWYCKLELDVFCDRPYIYPARGERWAHASHSQIFKSYRGLLPLFYHFNSYTYTTQSPEIGSSNLSHSHTCLLPQIHQMAQVIMCRCIQMLAGVRLIILRSASFLFSFVTEWNSGGRAQQVLWSPTVNDNVMIHSVGLQKQENFTEILDQAEWGTLYYAMENVSR